MVYMNDIAVAAPEGATLEELLKLQGRDTALTVVTVDGKFVARAEYKKTVPAGGAVIRVRELLEGG